MRKYRLISLLFVLISIGASLLVTFSVSAEGVDLRNGKSELEKQMNESSYKVVKQQNVVNGVTINIWGGSAFFGYGAMSNATGGGSAATIKCNPSSNDSFSLTGTIVSPTDLWAQIDKGGKPSIKIRWQIGAVNGDAEVLQKACSERYSEFTKTTETTVKDSETVENTIKLDTGDAAAEEALGQKLSGALRSSLLKDFDKSSWFKDLSSDDKLKAGCTYDPVDKKYACNAAAKERLFQRMLGTCARAALADKTGDQKTMIANCVSTNMYGDTSKAKTIAGSMKSITIDDLKKISEEAKKKAIDELTKEEENTKTCGSEVTLVGWIACPVTQTAVWFADFIWGIFEGMLRTSPLEQSSAYYEIWKGVRNIANVLFVIVFLIVVFSQVSSFGLSNYGIKKMLPRMIVAAIAINLSFFIVQIAVDIANIAGGALLDFITSVAPKDVSPSWDKILADIIGGAIGGAIVVMGVSVAAAGSISAGPIIIFLLMLLIPAIVGIIAGFLTLTVRSALIPIVAVFAPLAFVAYIFPNGQALFDKWRKTFTALLLLYPLAAAYYGALKLVALIMIGDEGNILTRMIGHTLLFAGCFVVLGIALKGNAITGRMYGSIQGGMNKVASPVRKMGMAASGLGIAAGWSRFKRQSLAGAPPEGSSRARRVASALTPGGVGRMFAGMDQKKAADKSALDLAKSDAADAYTDRLINDPGFALRAAGGDQAEADQLKERAQATRRAEKMKEEMGPLTEKISQWKARGANVDEELMKAFKGSGRDSEKDAIAHSLAQLGRGKQLAELREGATGEDLKSIQRAIDANAPALATKHPDLVKGAAAAFGAGSFGATDVAGWDTSTHERFKNHHDTLAKSDPAKAAATWSTYASALAGVRDSERLRESITPDKQTIVDSYAAPPPSSSGSTASTVTADDIRGLSPEATRAYVERALGGGSVTSPITPPASHPTSGLRRSSSMGTRSGRRRP